MREKGRQTTMDFFLCTLFGTLLFWKKGEKVQSLTFGWAPVVPPAVPEASSDPPLVDLFLKANDIQNS